MDVVAVVAQSCALLTTVAAVLLTLLSMLQAPDGAPADVWQQIVPRVLSEAADHFAQDVHGLQQWQAEHEHDTYDLRGQMIEMQNSMAAVLAHLKLSGRRL